MYFGFQVYMFSNGRDMTKSRSFCMTTPWGAELIAKTNKLTDKTFTQILLEQQTSHGKETVGVNLS